MSKNWSFYTSQCHLLCPNFPFPLPPPAPFPPPLPLSCLPVSLTFFCLLLLYIYLLILGLLRRVPIFSDVWVLLRRTCWQQKKILKKRGGNWRQKIRGGRLATNATTLDRGEGKSSGPKPDHIKCCCVEFVGGIGWRQTIFFKYRGGGLVAIEMGPATDRGGGISGHLKWSGGR